MRGKIYGNLDLPAVTTVGVWDPFTHHHRTLLKRLQKEASKAGLASLAVLLDPAPYSLIFGSASAPVYSDVPSRIQLIRSLGVDAVLLVRFCQRDVLAGADKFFALLDRHVEISSLWLGYGQSLGSLREGSFAAIRQETELRGVQLVPLPKINVKRIARSVRIALVKGGLQDIAPRVGFYPTWSRPRDRCIRLAWRPGLYSAVPLIHPSAPLNTPAVEIELVRSSDGFSTAPWPSSNFRYLAFTEGPARTPSNS